MSSSIFGLDFCLLWIANFLMYSSFYVLLPTIPTYAVQLGANTTQVGYLIGLFTLATLVIRPFSGYVLDVRGRKLTYVGGLLLFALVSFGYQWASTLGILLLVRFLHGLGWGVATVGGPTVATDLLPPARRGEGLGYYGLTTTLATAFGPLIGLLVLGNGAYGRLFVVGGMAALVAVGTSLLIRYPAVTGNGAPVSLRWSHVFEPRVVPVAVIAFFTYITYGGLVTFLTFFTREHHLSAGLFFVVYAVGMTLARPFAGRLLDRSGPTLPMVGGFVVYIAGFLILGVSRTTPVFALAAVLQGLGNGSVYPTVQAMNVSLVGPDKRGVANSVLASAMDLGIGVGSSLLGWFAGRTSLEAMFIGSGLILVIPLAYYVVSVDRYYSERALVAS